MHIVDFNKASLSEIQFYVMQEVTALYPDRAVFDHADKERFHMFDLVSGSKEIRERFSQRNRWEDVRDYWYKGLRCIGRNITPGRCRRMRLSASFSASTQGAANIWNGMVYPTPIDI